jgi:hypothetical protein
LTARATTWLGRVTTALLVVVSAVAAPSGGRIFECRVDGTLAFQRDCCCPPEGDRAPGHDAAPPALAEGSCCDVHPLDEAAPAAPAVLDGQRDALATPAAPPLGLTPPLPPPATHLVAERTPLVRAGPAVLLVKHSRLI